MKCKIWKYRRHCENHKVSAGNSGHPKTPDTWYISAMDECFGLKLLVLKHLPLGYIQAKNELKAQRHCAANRTFVLKTLC